MKLRLPLARWFFLLAVLGSAMLGTVGCKTASDDNNESSIPWNRPKSWENGMGGMMGGMNERR